MHGRIAFRLHAFGIRFQFINKCYAKKVASFPFQRHTYLWLYLYWWYNVSQHWFY